MGSGVTLKCRECHDEMLLLFGLGIKHGALLFRNLDNLKVITDLIKQKDIIKEAKMLIQEKHGLVNPIDALFVIRL